MDGVRVLERFQLWGFDWEILVLWVGSGGWSQMEVVQAVGWGEGKKIKKTGCNKATQKKSPKWTLDHDLACSL